MNITKYIAATILAIVVAACTDNTESAGSNVADGKVKLEISATGMGQHLVTSRSITKDPDETEIHNLHVFFFDNTTGEYLQPATGGESEEGKSYRYLSNGQHTLLIDGEQFVNPNNVDIYILANLADKAITIGSDGIPTAQGTRLSNRAALQNYIYTPYDKVNFTTRIPDTGLPMMGHMTGDFTIKGGQIIEVKLKSLMVRVDFNIKLTPKDLNVDLKYPILQINKVEMHNMPAGARIQEYNTGEETEGVATYNSEGSANIRLTTGESSSFHFYVFEHLRKTNGNTIPESITDEYKQRYKPTLAKDDAAYVLLVGQYIDNNGHPYEITYKLYLGANHTDDFNLTRNCKYVNNINVLGISAVNHPDNPDGEVGLDTRVTVSREDNDYYITILRERRHDAHFNVTPMDIYIPGRGSITVTVPDADGANKWIRLEAVEGTPNREGYGKRDYFTTDLLTNTLNNPINKSCTIDGTEPGLTVRRVYLYIDENASTKARSVPLEIYYTPTGEQTPTTPTQTLEIDQAGLLKATINDGGIRRTVYMETYEEYLDYFDPMSDFNSEQKYDGLPWGANGKEIGGIGRVDLGVFSGTFCSQNFTRGKDFTPYILDRLVKLGYTDQRKMKLSDIPLTAAAYALNKNKRNSDGTVAKVEWYLPGIREIEQAILPYYNDFPEFQGNYYWSSAAGEEDDFWISTAFNTYNEDTGRARATKAKYYPGGENNPDAPKNVNWNGEYCYIKSGVDEEGWLLRTKVCRIRCMRIPDGVIDE